MTKPAKSSPEVKQISNGVIEPETRVENKENAGQPFEQPNQEHKTRSNTMIRSK